MARGCATAGLLALALVAGAASAAPATPSPAAPSLPGPPDPGQRPFGPDSVQGVVRSHEPDLKACYEARLAEGKDVQGEMVLTFVIGVDGLPDRPRLRKSTLRDKDVEACVLRAVRRWIFPRPPRPQPVELPLKFDEIGRRAR